MKLLLQIPACLLWVLLQPLSSSPIPKFSELKDSILSSETILYDRDGKILQEIRTNSQERRLDWVNLEEISPYFLDALVFAEDKRFYEHSGVDFLALGSGFFRLFTRKSLRGASTISMQLVGILKEELRTRKRRTVYQKWIQILDARELERDWSKENILEAYVNLVSYRGELVGINSASRGLFGKSPHGLNREEGLLLASLVKHPSGNLERIRERACFLSLQTGSESCDTIQNLINTVFSRPYFIQQTYTLAPHLARKLIHEKKTGVTSTIDRDLQIFSIEALQRQISKLRSQNVRDGAVLVRDNTSGEVLAYVGGSDFSQSPEIDAVRAKRQAGSTLKPFLYALGLEKRRITALSLLSDSPFEVQIEKTGVYSPSNYQNTFHGMVSARNALGSSLNIPAIRLLDQIGVDEFHTFLEELGFNLPEEPAYYGLSLALGSAEISLWEAVSAYSSLGTGFFFESILLRNSQKMPAKQILSLSTAFLVSDILADNDARILSFGLDSPLSSRSGASVKTGTSKDMKDNWCIGYTDKYTVGVWVGNFSGEPMWNVSGVSGAAPVWQEIIDYLHKSPNKWLVVPEGVRSIELKFKDGSPGGREYFLEGTEPPFYPEPGNNPKNGILYPLFGEIIALDPDIPEARQVIFFEPKKITPKLEWKLNGEIFKNNDGITFWMPIRGKHQLELLENGLLVEKIFFEVR